ncbi:MAG: OmpA family protein [Acetobacteraceae bacterium]|nr:OmpA family protein [Acetobacteraceae bacterium]
MRVTLASFLATSAFLLSVAPAWSAGQDCAPLGAIPNYTASDTPVLRGYAPQAFKKTKDDGYEEIVVSGAYCRQTYLTKDGATPMSDLEIQSNYRVALEKLGAVARYSDDRATVATLTKAGQDTWMSVYSQETHIDVIVVLRQPHKQVLTAPSGHDHRLVGHMPTYIADPPTKRDFDKLTFRVQEGDDTREIEVRGAKYHVTYAPRSGSIPASDTDIQENYRAALKTAGAKMLFIDEHTTVARIETAGQSIWLSVSSQETSIEVAAIEEKAFQPSIRPPDAAELKTGLEKDGRIVLYVPFDFDKGTLKPEAAPIISAVARLLKDSAASRFAIEGHTDGFGAHDYNMKLSDARAKAVMAALVAAGVDASRLKAAGFGPDKPIADNATSEGRVRNRRVELVKS